MGPEDGGLVVVVHHCDGIGIGVCCHTTSGEAFGEVARGYGEFDTHAGCFDFCLAQAEGDFLLTLKFPDNGSACVEHNGTTHAVELEQWEWCSFLNCVSELGSPVCVGVCCYAMGLVRGRGHSVGEGLHIQLVRVVKEHVDELCVFGSGDNAVVVR